MTVLVVGATGATGRRLVERLLERGESVKAIVRAGHSLPRRLTTNDQLSIIEASETVQYRGWSTWLHACLGVRPTRSRNPEHLPWARYPCDPMGRM